MTGLPSESNPRYYITAMSFLDGITNRAGIAGELLRFFMQNKWWWITPMIIVLLLFGLLIIFAQTSAIAPFIYTLF
jgi:Family of unknown function (DUF5989)